MKPDPSALCHFSDLSSPKDYCVESEERLLEDFFSLDEAWVRYRQTNGNLSEPVRRLVFSRADGVAVLLHNTDQDTLVLVKQFRYPVAARGDAWMLEIVAGLVEPGETVEAVAKREAFEETGYLVSELESIAEFYVSPGGSTERLSVFFARVTDADRVGPGGGESSEGEDIEVVEIPRIVALTALEKGQVRDGKTFLALLWLKNHPCPDSTVRGNSDL